MSTVNLRNIRMEKEFTEWFKLNEKRFAHGQFDEKQIAYSSWLEGKKKSSIQIDNLETENNNDNVILGTVYTEKEVSALLQVQRGNCYVAVLSKTRDEMLATVANNAPEPNGGKWRK